MQVSIKQLLPLVLLCPALYGQTNYQTGIDITLAGTQGTDWDVEQFYHDPLVSDKKVFYIKSGTNMSFSHNARNRYTKANTIIGVNGVDGIADTGDEGVIRYKIDQDLSWGTKWTGGTVYPAYSTAFDFDAATYPDASSVLGSTGHSSTGPTLANKETEFWQGILDTVGDEWHTITVADDDSAFYQDSNGEYGASDGHIYFFVVNPKTPILKWTKDTGQFYTSQPKYYYLPRIHDQYTYFSGTCDVEIKDINGNNIHYRIVSDPADAVTAYTAAGASSVSLDETDFTDGTQYLQYYYAGNAAYTKTRVVVENPAFPSAGETHGDFLWGSNTAEKTRIDNKLASSWWMSQWKTSSFWNDVSGQDATLGTGLRTAGSDFADENAILAYRDGNDAARGGVKFAGLAKRQLLENANNVYPVGHELTWTGQNIPSREYQYRGYYDANRIFAAAYAYDTLINQYKSSQHANGITAVEDHYIRDSFAALLLREASQFAGINSNTTAVSDAYNDGMWTSARKTGVAALAMVIPSYKTPYGGTVGLDGSTADSDDLWMPFKDSYHTYKQMYFLPDEMTGSDYPDVRMLNGLGLEGNFTSEGKFDDRVSYYNFHLMGHCYNAVVQLMLRHYPTLYTGNYPNFELGLSKANDGILYGTKITNASDANPRYYSQLFFGNTFNGFFGVDVVANVEALETNASQHDSQINILQPFEEAWYDSTYTTPTLTLTDPTFSPVAGEYASTQNVAITVTSADTIYYTTDGSTPTTASSVYSGTISVSASQTIKAFGVKAGYTDSAITSAAYVIGAVVDPVLDPAGGTYASSTDVTMTTATAGASIYYTTDGSTPDATDNLYSTAVTVSADTTIKAIGIKGGSSDSAVVTEAYTISSYVTTNAWQSYTITNQTTDFTFQFDAVPSGIDLDAVIGLGDVDPATTYGDLAMLVRFNTNGEIDAYDGLRAGGAWYDADAVEPYVADTVYDIRIVADQSESTYDVFVTPDGGSETQIADNYGYRNAATNINTLSMYSPVGDVVGISSITIPPAAGTITLGNPVLREDGLEVAIQILDGNNSYSPQTGVTGVVVKGSGSSLTINSTVLESEIVDDETIHWIVSTLASKRQGGERITVTVTSSNVVDGIGSTTANLSETVVENLSKHNNDYARTMVGF